MEHPYRRYLILLPLILAAMLLAASMTGYLVYRDYSYTDSIGVLADSGTESFSWSPETPGELEYVMISGFVRGNGSARVYLQSGDERHLILDSEHLSAASAGSPVTGILAGLDMNESGGDSGEPVSGELPQGSETTETDYSQEAPEEAGPSGGEPAPDEAEEGGTPEETIPAGTAETQPEESAANETEPPEETPTETDAGMGNETEPAQTPENVTGPLNATEENMTGYEEPANVTVPESNVTEQANETLLPDNVTGANVTGPAGEENITEEVPPVTEPVEMAFEGQCIDTCSLEGFSEESYLLVFEIEPGTVMRIDSIEYSIRVPQEPENVTAPENITETPPSENLTNITAPENITGLLEANLTFFECIGLNKSIQLLSAELLDMWARGFGMHKCNSTEDCNEKISSMASGGIITLEGALECSGDCLEFRDSMNIILDCMNNPITGNGSGSGISLENSTYVIIKNCDVSGFERGIALDKDSDFNIITNTKAGSNVRDITIPSSVSNIMNNINATITVSGRGA